MTPRLARGAAVASATGLPDESYLGWMATYTLPDEPQNGAKVARIWAKHGLDVDFLPEARQPVHIFQSAAGSVRSRRPSDANNARMEITSDEVDNNGTCAYQITVRTWDRANRSIEHEKAMRVVFDKRTSDISVDRLDAWDAHMAELEAAIRKDFERNARTVPGQKIRVAVRDQLLALGAQNLRRKAGGLYFVPRSWRNGEAHDTKPTLAALKDSLGELYGDRADFYTWGLVGEDAQKEMVRKHFALNVNVQVDELMEKVVNRVRAGRSERAIRSDLVANVFNERRKIAAAIKQFNELVDVEMGDLTGNLGLLDKALGELDALANDGGDQ